MSVTLKSLNDQITAMKTEMASLRELMAQKSATAGLTTPVKKAKTVKPKDPDAPKKEVSWWIKATQNVRNVLKPHIAEYNASLGEDGKKMPGTTPVSVAKLLKEDGHISSENFETTEKLIIEAFNAYKENMTSSADEGSVVSKISKPPKFSDLSDDEKSEKRKASAAKAAATRKAKKESAAAASSHDADKPWTHDGISYLRIGDNLWNAETDKWVGAWDEATKKINKKANEPERAAE